MTIRQWTAGLSVTAVGEYIEPRNPNGYAYKATVIGVTGTLEPIWPTVVATTVVDGTVTWECVQRSKLTWTARALHKTGATEPAWPTAAGGTIVNGTATFQATVPIIADVNCPQTKGVVITAGHVFAIKSDIVRFSAAPNPLDWTAVSNAGFLPTGMNSPGDSVATAVGVYRGSLVVFMLNGIQVWQADPDPTRMTLTDLINGAGTPYTRSHVTVSGDLLYISPAGVRSMSVTGLQGTSEGAADVGTPVDSLIQGLLSTGFEPRAIFYPKRSEAWFIIGNQVAVLRMSKIAELQAWQRFTFPEQFDAETVANGNMYIQSGQRLYVLDAATYTDETAVPSIPQVRLETPYAKLDGGASVMVTGIELRATADTSVRIRYDERNTLRITSPNVVPAITVPGATVPVFVNSPSIAVVTTHEAATAWELVDFGIIHSGGPRP